MGATAATFLTSLIPPLPFLLAGVLPLWVGALLAGVSGLPLRSGVLGAGTLAVLALILAAFAGREVFCPGAGRCPAWKLTFAPKPKTPKARTRQSKRRACRLERLRPIIRPRVRQAP